MNKYAEKIMEFVNSFPEDERADVILAMAELALSVTAGLEWKEF